MFTIGLFPGGMPVDMSKTQMVWSTSKIKQNLQFGGTGNTAPPLYQWKITNIRNGNQNTILEAGEQFDIWAKIGDSPANGLVPGEQFTLEIIPPVGRSLSIARTAPSSINSMNIMY